MRSRPVRRTSSPTGRTSCSPRAAGSGATPTTRSRPPSSGRSPARRAASTGSPPARSGRDAGVAHQPSDRDGVQVRGADLLAELREEREPVAEIGDPQLDHLSGVDAAERLTWLVEPDRTRDQPAARAVREPPLSDARAARGVQEVTVPVPELPHHAMELVA